MKTCTNCKKEKSLKEFHKDKQKKDGLRSWCKECVFNYLQNRLKDNSQHVRDLDRKNYLKRTYGITIEEYEKLFCIQNGVCAICGEEEDKINLSVDHSHITGKVRSLLCKRCNMVLGVLGEDKKYIQEIINYLEFHNK